LLQVVPLYGNYFQPSFKLRARVRKRAKVKKSYHPPTTPCERLLAHEAVEEKTTEQLRTQRERLDSAASDTVIEGGDVSVSSSTIDAAVRGGSVSTSGDTSGASPSTSVI